MADETLGTAIVTDRRTRPTGVLPRSAQTWLMVALAIGILVVIVVTGRPASTTVPRSDLASRTLEPNPERLRDYQDRLRLLEQRAEQPAPLDTPPPAPLLYREPAILQAPDPSQEEQRRRDAQSLFAANVAWSRAGRATSVEQAPSVTAPSQPAATESAINVSEVIRPQPTPTRHRLVEGTIIETVLTNRLDGANAAPVNCLVTSSIYSRDGQYIVIPAGARLLGQTNPVQSFGESRLAVSFHRLMLPDGTSHPLDQYPALNQIGDAALRDRVNHHYLETFGAAAAIGLISGLGQLASTGGLTRASGDAPIAIAGDATDAGSQAVGQAMNRFLNRPPTVTIREGHRVNVYLTSDLELPAYESAPINPPSR